MGKIAVFITSAITTVTIFFQCLFGIGGLGFGKVALALEKDAYPLGTETIEAVLTNGTRAPILVAPYAYSLERWEGGEWTRVALKDSVFIPIANFFLQPFQSADKSFRLTDHEALSAGRYRLTASGSAYAEFELI